MTLNMPHETPHDPLEERLLHLNRRQFFGGAGAGLSATLGMSALSTLSPRALAGDTAHGQLGAPHHAPRARRVIYLHMMGAPSQLDLYDWKPGLVERAGEDLRAMPEIYNNQRITGMTSGQATLPLVPSRFRFTRQPNLQDGAWISELLPYTARLTDKLAFVRSMHTEAINHEPGITFLQTGSQIPGRPSIGAWLSYGLGSSNSDLPAFIVMISQGFGNMQTLSARMWGSGFLPSENQGVRFRGGSDPVLFLSNPAGVDRADRRRMLDTVAALNEREFARSGDPEVQTRIAQGEMAFRMQMSVPELTDFSNESKATLDMYGPDVVRPGTFAANCLLARRLAERDVRFIQLYHRGWDGHGNLPREITQQARAVDQPQAALIADLEQRGLLEDTLVVWGGEFGRTAYCQGNYSRDNYGRAHHPRCFTMWMTGGGIQPGIVYGETDELGYNIVKDPVHVHDLHATMLHCLGIDHEALTFRYQGRRYRLTDVAGEVVRPLLA